MLSGVADIVLLDDSFAALLPRLVLAAVLFVPTLYTYFGLTGPTSEVFSTVLPALVLWFATLSLVYRFRLLDRVLGLTSSPSTAVSSLAVGSGAGTTTTGQME